MRILDQGTTFFDNVQEATEIQEYDGMRSHYFCGLVDFALTLWSSFLSFYDTTQKENGMREGERESNKYSCSACYIQ